MYRAADLVTMPRGPPRPMLGLAMLGRAMLGVLVAGIMLFPAWSEPSSSSMGPCSTSAGMARSSWLVEGLTWKNKDKDQNETWIARKHYPLVAPGIRVPGAGGPGDRTD